MNWIKEAKILFNIDKPAHFTNHEHCEECAEHDETLLSKSIDSIGLDEIGNEGWDPICFCSNEGKVYYMPSFIRLSLDSIKKDFYLGQFLFHLMNDGEGNSLFLFCSKKQRAFIVSFLEFMINSYEKEIERECCTDNILRAHEIWSKT